jgi:PadR family transcriptional regulator, regulatory protein AphA
VPAKQSRASKRQTHDALSEGRGAGSSAPLDTSVLTVSEHAILGLLSFGERSGYELFRFAERSVGYIWAPAKSQIYKVLPRLARTGLARARFVEQTKRPDKQLYRLTPAGRRALRQWLTTVEIDDESDIYLLKIFFGRQAPRAALIGQVAAFRDASAARLKRYEELDRRLARDEDNALPLQVLAHGLLRTRATVEWADALLTELRRMEP